MAAWGRRKLVVALAARVLSRAMPVAPPTCWVVLTSADPTPVSWPRSRAVPRLMAGAKIRPRPRPRISSGPRTAAGELLVTVRRGSPALPAAPARLASRRGGPRPERGRKTVGPGAQAGEGEGVHGRNDLPGRPAA